MSAEHDPVAGLRDAFDRSFAQAPIAENAVLVGLLAIRIGGDPHLLRMTDVSGLFADKVITWLPSHVAALRGIAGFRGTVLPVCDLGLLLGCARAAALRWLVVMAGTPVALAFERFDGYLKVRGDTIVPNAVAEGRGRPVREVLRTTTVQPVIHLPGVLDLIRLAGGHGTGTRQS